MWCCQTVSIQILLINSKHSSPFMSAARSNKIFVENFFIIAATAVVAFLADSSNSHKNWQQLFRQKLNGLLDLCYDVGSIAITKSNDYIIFLMILCFLFNHFVDWVLTHLDVETKLKKNQSFCKRGCSMP